VRCTRHGIRLCTNVVNAREKSLIKLYKTDETVVTDYSWTCLVDASCWTKFHDFYEPQGLFTNKQINMNEGKIKFAGAVYTSDLYQKKSIRY
jgi:hypothetical protein